MAKHKNKMSYADYKRAMDRLDEREIEFICDEVDTIVDLIEYGQRFRDRTIDCLPL